MLRVGEVHTDQLSKVEVRNNQPDFAQRASSWDTWGDGGNKPHRPCSGAKREGASPVPGRPLPL